MVFETPILINVFNRADTTKRVFDVIRHIEPKRLFIAADGPRTYVVGDSERCNKVKEVFENIDWDCEVKTLFRKKNMGCPKAIPDAIDWFFSYVNKGIILEDDCLPNESFFQFSSELLKRYKGENKVMMISGNNFIPTKKITDYSYFFSKYAFVWGWATWKRAWEKFDDEMKSYPAFSRSKNMKVRCPDILDRFFWKTAFNNKYQGYSEGWAMKWNYALSSNGGLSVIPYSNLVENIGFGPNATMTKEIDKNMVTPMCSISFPLKHPKVVEENISYDKRVFRRNFLSTVNFKNLFTNYKNAHRSGGKDD